MFNLFAKKAKSVPDSIRGAFNSVNEELGWYYGTKDSKKPGTPKNWVLKIDGTRSSKWADPERKETYLAHKLVQLGKEFTLFAQEPAMLLEDEKNLENNFAIVNQMVLERTVVGDNGKLSAYVAVRLKLRLGKKTAFTDLTQNYGNSGGATGFGFHGFIVSLVSADAREGSVALTVEKNLVTHA